MSQKTNSEDLVYVNPLQGYKGNSLTKREYFAALIVQGLFSRNEIHIHEIAEIAIYYADKLIEELNKEQS